MANLNLSEFTEKLFVADADHTFIWDSAASISKRVSRNSWLNSGTLTSDAPVTISQTWNNAAVAFTGLKVNAVSTASADASLLLDLQLGGVTQVNSTKAGSLFARIFVSGNSQTSRAIEVAASGIAMGSLGVLAFAPASSYASNSDLFNVADTFLRRDGAPNTLALRNGAAAQTFRVYNTYSNAGVDVEYLQLSTSASGFRIGTNSSGSGSSRPLFLGVGGGSQWQINTSGHIGTFGSDNLYDIGASGANRPRTIYAASGINAGSGSTSVFQSANFIALNFTGGTYGGTSNFALFSPADGVLRLTNGATTDFNRLQFGGTTDSFPAIARDGAGIKFTGAAAGATSWIKVPPVAVGSLPLAATAGAGARAFVNDALAPTFGSAVTGGGAVLVPVYSDGSAWNVG